MSISVTINKAFHIITDWLLIVLGAALLFIAYRAIDVEIVKYIVMVIGVSMAITGFWCRFKRLKKKG